MIRRTLTTLYRRLRKIDDADLSELSTSELIKFATRRAISLSRGVVRSRQLVFRDAGVRIIGPRNLAIGRSVAIGRNVLVDAVGGAGIYLHESVTVDVGAILRVSGVYRNPGIGIVVGPRTAIGAYNLILGQGGVSIGTDVLLGPHVTIVSENHNWSDDARAIREQGESREQVVIGNDCWLGAGVTVLAGARIGDGCVIAANAVVRGSLEPFGVYAGVPARRIGARR